MTRLKDEDPFMYYSIPEVRIQNYKFEENNANAVAAALLDDSNREGNEAGGGVEAGMVDEDVRMISVLITDLPRVDSPPTRLP